MMNTLIKMLKDESGASAAEYALILAIVGTGIAIAALLLGGAIGNSMNQATNCINTPGTANCGAAAAPAA
jgi:pilus assembly protein Flp/PilA